MMTYEVDAVCSTLMTFSTVGYGDIYPKTAAEELIACLMMIFGILLFGFIIGTSRHEGPASRICSPIYFYMFVQRIDLNCWPGPEPAHSQSCSQVSHMGWKYASEPCLVSWVSVRPRTDFKSNQLNQLYMNMPA